MVRKLAHQVKFELDQGDWVLGILARRLYNTDTCTISLSFNLCPKVFHSKRQSDSLRILISLGIPDNMVYSLMSLPITYTYPHSYPMGGYYLRFSLRTRQRINMVRRLAHQVKFELDQRDWILGFLARLYNTNTCTLHF